MYRPTDKLMSNDSSHFAPPHHHVNWRVAAIIEGQTQPLYGHTIEASESNIVVSFDRQLPTGLEFRVYLDIPDPDSGRPAYVDFRAKVQETSLMGQVSLFRHMLHITQILPDQQAYLKRTLTH